MSKHNARAPAGRKCYVSWDVNLFYDSVGSGQGAVLKRGRHIHAGSSHIMSQMSKESDDGASLCVAQYRNKIGTCHLNRETHNAGPASVEPKPDVVKNIRTADDVENLDGLFRLCYQLHGWCRFSSDVFQCWHSFTSLYDPPQHAAQMLQHSSQSGSIVELSGCRQAIRSRQCAKQDARSSGSWAL